MSRPVTAGGGGSRGPGGGRGRRRGGREGGWVGERVAQDDRIGGGGLAGGGDDQRRRGDRGHGWRGGRAGADDRGDRPAIGRERGGDLPDWRRRGQGRRVGQARAGQDGR